MTFPDLKEEAMDVKSKRSRIYLLAVVLGILLVLGIFLVIGIGLGDGSEYDTDDPDGTVGSMSVTG